MTTSDVILLLGRDHPAYGTVQVASTAGGLSAAAISVGSDTDSPSLAHKGDPELCPNEDGLLLVEEGDRVLLAVSDGHHGEEAGHRLLELLRAAIEVGGAPRSLDELVLRIRGLRYPDDAPARQPDSGTTLVVATLDRAAGKGALVSFGDSTFAWVGPTGERRINVKLTRFVSLDRPQSLLPGGGFVTEFDVAPGGLLLAFTDGIDECHYGAPRTSVRGRHRAALFGETGPEPRTYVERLARLALDGVGGRPGGQDNVAVVAART